MAEMTNKEKKEYEEIVKGAKQLSIFDYSNTPDAKRVSFSKQNTKKGILCVDNH